MKTNITESIIKPEHFRLPQLSETVFLFFILHHFFLFREMVNGGKISSYGPAKTFSFTHHDTNFSALGGFIGAPLAVIVAENAMVSGAGNLKAFGTAGCVSSRTIEIGELHRPAGGVDETGMIADYDGTDTRTRFSYGTQSPSCRNIVSVNSFYRLTPANLKRYHDQQVDLIDMEATALNHVIAARGASFEPLFVVSDKVQPDGSWQYESRSSRLTAGVESGLQQLLI